MELEPTSSYKFFRYTYLPRTLFQISNLTFRKSRDNSCQSYFQSCTRNYYCRSKIIDITIN
jgi:hypothetical protein